MATETTTMKKKIAISLLGVLLIMTPFIVPAYVVFQLTSVLGFVIAILGLNLLTGYNGQTSIGHGAFFAIGAYVTAIATVHGDVPYWLTPLLGGVVCLLFGFLLGIPALRLAGHYLALATFALASAMPQILKHRSVAEWTGGAQGIVLNGVDPPFWLPLTTDQWMFYFTLFFTAISIWLARNLVRGRIGRAMIAIRDNSLAASASGVNVAMTKSIIFGISAAFTGVAGSLSALLVQLVAPDSFTVFLSISLLVGVVIGGLSTISGAIYGALFIQFMPNIADAMSKEAPWAIYGVMLILFMYFMPGGIASGVGRLQKIILRTIFRVRQARGAALERKPAL